MTKTLHALSLAAVALVASCRGKPAAPPAFPPETAVYTRVGMHFDAKGGEYIMYSTNYVGLPHFVPPGTAMTIRSYNRRGVMLADSAGSQYEIRYVEKHNLMPFGDWMETNFSTGPVSLPSSLTDDEKDAIAKGEVREGMSRQAVLLAIGYPPKSSNPSETAKTLTYDRRRGGFGRHMRLDVTFGDDDRVSSVEQ